MNMLTVSGLNKRFGTRLAVDDVSFSVAKGEVFGLLGPNGAGKSTTLSLISGLKKPAPGCVTVDGYDMAIHPAKAKAKLGVVPQEPAIYRELTARQNLRFFAEMNDLSGEGLETAVIEALQVVGLTERADEKSDRFSGGMQRRLNIAAGMVHRPDLVIMDEPTVGVDPQSRRHILDTVKKLRDGGTSVIYTSHYVEEVEELCDRVAIMDHGRIIAAGTIPTLLSEAGEYHELLIKLGAQAAADADELRSIPGVHEALVREGSVRVLTSSAEQVLPLVFTALVAASCPVQEIKIKKPSLETLFLKLTGKALRDN